MEYEENNHRMIDQYTINNIRKKSLGGINYDAFYITQRHVLWKRSFRAA